MLFYKNLEEIVLNNHLKNNANELIILSGFVGPSPIEKISNADIDTKIIYGCFPRSGISKELHKKYIKINNNSSAKIFFSRKYNHSKIYCWKKDNVIVDILIGSANFSTNGLNNDGEEVLLSVSEDDFTLVENFLDKTLLNSDNCSSVETSDKKISVDKNKTFLDEIISIDPPKVSMFIGARGRKIPDKSGINWGHGSGHNTKDTAELRIRVDLVRRIPQFFPNNGVNINYGSGQSLRNPKPNAEILFDDGAVMDLSFEQESKTKDGVFYKAICSYPKKNILGRYLRRRLGLNNDAKITEKDLKNYGRDTIDLTLLEEGVYFGDFSVEK